MSDDFDVGGDAPDEFTSMLVDGLYGLNWFVMLIVVLLYVLSEWTEFNTNVLGILVPGSIDMSGNKTGKGVIVVGTVLAIVVGLLDVLHRSNYI
jgi:hypothetical protein